MPSPSDFDSWYRTLDLEPGAAPAQIEEGWKLLASAWHPDKFAGAFRDKATRRLQEINRARDELGRYWREHRQAPPSAASAVGNGAARPAPRAMPKPARAGAAIWPGALVKSLKWLLLLAVVWLTWRPLPVDRELAVIQTISWLVLLAGFAQFCEAVLVASVARLRGRR